MAASCIDPQKSEEEPLLPISSIDDDGTSAGDDDEEAQRETPPSPPPPDLTLGEACCGIVTLVLMIMGVVWIYRHWPNFDEAYKPADYSVSIAAVSGLDPDTNLVHHDRAITLLDPAFNLTYLRCHVLLATGPAPQFCVDPGEQREEGSVVAWGSGVRLPGFVLDSLAADLRRGTAEFGVKLVAPTPYCGGGGAKEYCPDFVRVISCSRAKIGAPPTTSCTVSQEHARLPVPAPGQGESGYRPQPTH